MRKMAFYVAATGQNVGKTTMCLGLVSGLKERCGSVGYMKPVGQESVETDSGASVDKDVLLFQSHFGLEEQPEMMSPVLFPRGFTRDYLDGKVDGKALIGRIIRSFEMLNGTHPATVVEGTGHMGVGSIVGLNNAQVAATLGVPVVLVASGGLGSSFDEITLNKILCDQLGVRLAGVILNRVLDDKREMVLRYMQKALSRWNVPILGAVPFSPFLSTPTLKDFEHLFQTELLTGQAHRLRHLPQISLIATTVELYKTSLSPGQLIITPAGREEIILTTLTRYWDLKISHPEEEVEMGMILTGRTPPKESLVEQIRRAEIPMLYVPLSSFAARKMINSYTAKIRREDVEKINEAVDIVSRHIDFERLVASVHSPLPPTDEPFKDRFRSDAG
jgi:dethiobiotin synthetase